MIIINKLIFASCIVGGGYYADDPQHLSEIIYIMDEDFDEESCNSFVK